MAALNTPTKHVVELSDEELFVLKIGLSQVSCITDSEYRTVAKIAQNLDRKLPESATNWADVEFTG